jgi:hypothetical protein
MPETFFCQFIGFHEILNAGDFSTKMQILAGFEARAGRAIRFTFSTPLKKRQSQ